MFGVVLTVVEIGRDGIEIRIRDFSSSQQPLTPAGYVTAIVAAAERDHGKMLHIIRTYLQQGLAAGMVAEGIPARVKGNP